MQSRSMDRWIIDGQMERKRSKLGLPLLVICFVCISTSYFPRQTQTLHTRKHLYILQIVYLFDVISREKETQKQLIDESYSYNSYYCFFVCLPVWASTIKKRDVHNKKNPIIIQWLVLRSLFSVKVRYRVEIVEQLGSMDRYNIPTRENYIITMQQELG